mmetsp:Transcript_9831/g.25843  ORF Transcript_9831/g.25843 Transcript_9831/m.25843 type:complete len:200 (+) Transcript_9831:445-1044(+)
MVPSAAGDLAGRFHPVHHKHFTVLLRDRLNFLDKLAPQQFFRHPRDGVRLQVALVLQILAPSTLVAGAFYELVDETMLSIEAAEFRGDTRIDRLEKVPALVQLCQHNAVISEQRVRRTQNRGFVRPSQLRQVLFGNTLGPLEAQPVEGLRIVTLVHLQLHARPLTRRAHVIWHPEQLERRKTQGFGRNKRAQVSKTISP